MPSFFSALYANGTAIPMMIAMIATTIMISIRVKADCFLIFLLLSRNVRRDRKHGREDAQQQKTDTQGHDDDHHRLDHVREQAQSDAQLGFVSIDQIV